MEESVFLKHVGNSPRMRIVQHFIEGRELEYTLTDLLEAHVSWRTVNRIIPQMLSLGIIQKTRKVGRATLYQINNTNLVTQQFMKIYDYLLTQSLEEVTVHNKISA